MKIGVAQLSSQKGNIDYNIVNHLRYIEKAGLLGIQYVVFPELSLTGYEPKLASTLAIKIDDERLTPIIEAAVNYQICIGVGAPLLSEGLPKIGLIVINKTGAVESYEKIHLHEGEEIYFDYGKSHHLFQIGEETIANAICADTCQPIHAKLCSLAGATIYMAGVLVTPDGYDEDAKKWANYASEHNMLVAIANYNKPSGGLLSAGKSAIWFKNDLLARAGEIEDVLVVAEKKYGNWVGEIHKI